MFQIRCFSTSAALKKIAYINAENKSLSLFILTQFSDKNHNKSRRNFFENRNMMAKAEQVI